MVGGGLSQQAAQSRDKRPHGASVPIPHYSLSSFAHSATPPSFTYVSNQRRTALCAKLLLPDCVSFSYCSPIASASAAARYLRSPFASASTAPQLHLLQLLLAACVCFKCYSPIASASTAPLHCVRFSCCSPIALIHFNCSSPYLRPLQLLLHDCVRFSCCSLIASPSAAGYCLRPLQLLLPDCVWISCCSLIAFHFNCCF